MHLLNTFRSKYKTSTRFGTAVPSSGSYSEQSSTRPTASRYCLPLLQMIQLLQFGWRINLNMLVHGRWWWRRTCWVNVRGGGIKHVDLRNVAEGNMFIHHRTLLFYPHLQQHGIYSAVANRLVSIDIRNESRLTRATTCECAYHA
jgi:hypothetical protein